MALPLDLGLLESDKRFQNMYYHLARKEFLKRFLSLTALGMAEEMTMWAGKTLI